MPNPSREQIKNALARHYLFSSLTPDQLGLLAEQTRAVRLESEQILFHHGDQAERFFLVGEGLVKLFRVTPDGQEKVMELMGPDRSFGEAIMFMERQRYPVSAQALKASLLYSIPNQAYLQLLRSSPEACFRMLADLSQRLHGRLAEIENLSLQNAAHRVARYLLRRLPADAADGSVLQLEAPKQVIASRLGMTPETFSRVLSTLSRQGAIEVDGRTLRILRIDALEV